MSALYNNLKSLGTSTLNALHKKAYSGDYSKGGQDERMNLWITACIIEYFMDLNNDINEDFGSVEADQKTLHMLNVYAENKEKLKFANSVKEFNAKNHYVLMSPNGPFQHINIVATAEHFRSIRSALFTM